MSDSFSRREWLKTIGVIGAGALVTPESILGATPVETEASATAVVGVVAQYDPGTIVDLYSTSDIFIPPRGRDFQKFSFDFPEP